jgi:hypothetical protein
MESNSSSCRYSGGNYSSATTSFNGSIQQASTPKKSKKNGIENVVNITARKSMSPSLCTTEAIVDDSLDSSSKIESTRMSSTDNNSYSTEPLTTEEEFKK